MAEDIFQGYKGKALGVLRKFNVRVWGQTVIETIRGKLRNCSAPLRK